ncbi:MAG: LysR family transcriptional regulator [Actinomycetota bacterium]
MHESLDRPHLDLLIAVRHTGHLGRAAAQLAISPSAASHRLKEAERRLGVTLTVAEGRSLRLTDAALHLADVAEVATASMRSAEETARWMNSTDRATVRIALDFYDTAPWFERLVESDDLTVDVDFVRTPYFATVDFVERRRVDLGLIVVPIDDPVRDPLADDHLVAIVRDDHPAVGRGRLEPSDVSDATYLTVGDRPHHGFEHHEFFEPARVRPRRLRKVESLAMILRLQRRFGGITVQPALAVRDAELDGLAVVPLATDRIAVRWDFVTRPEPTDAERATCDVIRSLVA